MRPRHAILAVAFVSALLVAALARQDSPPGGAAASAAPLLGVTRDGGRRWLVRVHPLSLAALPGRRVRMDAPPEAWSLSPGGSRLAALTDRASVLRFIDVDGMRPAGSMPTRGRGSPTVVLWTRPRRLWIVVGCCALGSTTVLTVDPMAQRVIARRRLAGGLARVAASPDGPVLLLAPPAMIGPATLATVDAAGDVEELPLDGMSAGVMPTEGVPFVERVRTPALAVDPSRRRAYVLSARPHAVEVDLRRWRVRHHRLVSHVSLLDRLREWLEPSAAASPRLGPVRTATWLGRDRIALSGHDAGVVWRPDGGVDAERRPAGLRVVDTRDWSVRTVDERAAAFHAAAGLLLTGGPPGRGLTAYSPDGRGAFQLLRDRRAEVVATAGRLAYVRTPPERALHVVDLQHGRAVGRSAPGRVRLLLEDVPAGWD